MNSIVQRGAIAAGVATTALAGMAGAASAATVKGIVIHHNRKAHSFVVADPAGRLYAIHAARAPRIGSDVVVAAKRLRDGTYRLQHDRVVRHSGRRVRVRGVVSWVDHRTGSFVVSAAGVSLLVVHHNGMRAHVAGSSTTTGTTPSVGSVVVATGTVDTQGELSDQSVQSVGQDLGGISLEGTILAVDPVAQTITVSADDSNQSGSSITVSVPATFALSQFVQGEEVELKVQPTGTGTATLLGSANDGNAQAANSQSDSQGQNAGSGDGTDQPDNSGQSNGQSDNSGQSNGQSDNSGQTTTTGGQTTTTGGQTTTTGGQTTTTGGQTTTTSSGGGHDN